MQDDELLFSDELENYKNVAINNKKWKILIVDDEEDIHSLTKMVLSGYKYAGIELEILSAFSGKEAIDVLSKNNDIALILLDVVMETEDAGLVCVKKIRDDLGNKESRIILRTGQPGQAPEQDIILNYDINDYKAKTELTSSKLFTAVTTSLRAYEYIKTIKQNKIGLENIITATSFLFEVKSCSLFAKGILKQLTSILKLDSDSMYINCTSMSAYKKPESTTYTIAAGTGSYSDRESDIIDNINEESIFNKLFNSVNKKQSVFEDNTYTGYFETTKGHITLLYFQWQRPLTDMEKELINIFSNNISSAFENLSNTRDIIKTQEATILELRSQLESMK